MTHVQDEIRETPCRKGPLQIGTVQTLSARCFIFLRPVLCEPHAVFALPLGPRKVYHSFSADLQTLPRKCRRSRCPWEGRGKGTIKGDYRGFKGDRV